MAETKTVSWSDSNEVGQHQAPPFPGNQHRWQHYKEAKLFSPSNASFGFSLMEILSKLDLHISKFYPKLFPPQDQRQSVNGIMVGLAGGFLTFTIKKTFQTFFLSKNIDANSRRVM